ncbi:MAG TPA: single-stranded DNA-binding protein [Xylella sp.]
MSVVRVKDMVVNERHFTGKSGPVNFREQRACIVMGSGYEAVFNLGLGLDSPYAPGDYLIHPDSYAHDRYGNLTLGRISLIPLASAMKDFVSGVSGVSGGVSSVSVSKVA